MKAASALPAVTAASVVAGPLFLTSAAVASLYLELPKPIVLEFDDVILFFFTLLPAVLLGFVPAFPLNLIGSSVMIALAGIDRPQLPAEIWVAAGAATGAAIAASLGAAAEIGFALVATSAVCAWICRKGADPH